MLDTTTMLDRKEHGNADLSQNVANLQVGMRFYENPNYALYTIQRKRMQIPAVL